ncbi:MAG: peptidase [Hyphomicrobiales bacterium]|nr:peptidase [Hyphomicrobiales bacterium]
MNIWPQIEADDIGAEIFDLAAEIFPICRSITGDGVRQTLDILGRHIDLARHEVPSGSPAFDWTIPNEWVIRDAFIKDKAGRRIVDFAASNLHVLNYSAPVHATIALAELKQHVFTLPEQPDLIPYRTSYYAERWGFCMSHKQLIALPEGEYEVCIDSELKDGSLSYGEHLHRGNSDREILLYAHICHPSLANDNCSGLALLTCLARHLQGRTTRYSYRFVFAPGTIGSLAWLSRNEDKVPAIDHGLVVSCVGDGGGPTYKRSRRGIAIIDRAMIHVVQHSGFANQKLLDFSPYGYDERQFCSPGFNMPVGLFQRSAFATFPEYHTSADNLDFIRPEHLASSYRMISDALEIIEKDWTPLNLSPKGEPQLGRRGLYADTGGNKSTGQNAMALLWVLNLADGSNSLLAIAERSGIAFSDIARAAGRLREAGLLAEA